MAPVFRSISLHDLACAAVVSETDRRNGMCMSHPPAQHGKSNDGSMFLFVVRIGTR